MRAMILVVGLALFASYPRAQDGQAELQKNQQQNMERMRKMQEQQMEMMKKDSPKAYEEAMKQRRQGEALQNILDKSRKGELSEAEAKKRLRPLVKEMIQPELAGLDEQIARLEKKLSLLKEAKRNPDALVEQRMDQMLGKQAPGNFPPF